MGDVTAAEQVANGALATTDDPDLLIDLHGTLVQCRALAGRFAESLAALREALARPGISGRNRARLLVLIAQTHRHLGEIEMADQAAAEALTEASEAGDNWAIGWALLLLIITAAMQGRTADALPLYDRALAVTEAETALTDLRLMLLINKAVTLGDLDLYEDAFASAREAKQLADRAGIVVRRAQARCCLGELLFNTGHWDDAMAEVGVAQEVTKDPGVACCDHGIAAVICFHRASWAPRGVTWPRPRRMRSRSGTAWSARWPWPAAWTPSRRGRCRRRSTCSRNSPTTRRNSTRSRTCWPTASGSPRKWATRPPRALSGRAVALADDTDIPHRQANALYCQGLVDQDAGRLLKAAEHYRDARRPLLGAKALEAAAVRSWTAGTVTRPGTPSPVPSSSMRHWVRPGTSPGCRPGSASTAPPRAQAKHRQARHGWESLTPAEMTVAALVEQGMSNPQIADKLFLSRKTVATHVSHILGKLGVRSRIDVAREAAGRRAAAS